MPQLNWDPNLHQHISQHFLKQQLSSTITRLAKPTLTLMSDSKQTTQDLETSRKPHRKIPQYP